MNTKKGDKQMKKYLIRLKSGYGARVHIAFYADTPNKNYRVYYNGHDTGKRYEKIGNAARYLRYISERWNENGQNNIVYEYGTKNAIPRRGTNA
jgi:hypothetical protein